MNNTNNPIAIRSKDLLAKSLISLMHKKDFKDISVSELTQHADLSRRTFYRLFSSKEEILLYHILQIWEKESPKLYNASDHSYFYTSYFHMNFWYKNKELALLLYQNDLIIIFQKFIDSISEDVYKQQKSNSPLNQNPDALEYTHAYSTGGALNLIWKWCSHGMTKTPKEVMELLMLSYQK